MTDKGRGVWGVGLAVIGVVASWRLGTGQTSGWVATPARPVVGDTVWLAGVVAAPPGWRVRAGRLEPTDVIEPLGEPVVLRAPGGAGWVVRYPVVAWTPGLHRVAVPPVWRLGPDGSADSVPGGVAQFELWSVLPTRGGDPAPQPALDPLRPPVRRALPPTLAVLAAASVLAGLVRWRRRRPRRLRPAPQVPLEREVQDARWIAAGEPKAVAARAAHRLRAAVAGAVPDAHEALSTAECLAALERARPAVPLRELRDVLVALDQVAFASAHGVDVLGLAARARRLAGEFAR